MAAMTLLLLLMIVSYWSSGCLGSSVLCVIPPSMSGHIDTECPSDSYSNKTLQELSSRDFSFHDRVWFLPGNHHLKTVMVISGVRNYSMGASHMANIACNSPDAGFRFENFSGLAIYGLSLFRCGVKFDERRNRASLIFINGSDLCISRVSIFYAFNGGIMVSNVSRTTGISQLEISRTMATRYYNSENLIEYKNCDRYSQSSLEIQNSKFDGNIFHKRDYTFNKKFKKVSLTGGLNIVVRKCNMAIKLSNSTFRNNSGNRNGASLAVTVWNITNSANSSLNISNVIFESGFASARGAGLFVSIGQHFKDTCPYHPLNPLLKSAVVSIHNATFDSNVANVAGAALYMEERNSPSAHCIKQIFISNCTFTNNLLLHVKKGGVALHSNEFITTEVITQFSPQYEVHLSKSSFRNNTNKMSWKQPGNSVVFINSNHYFKMENVTIVENNSSAIIAVSSNLLFKGNVTLSHNRGNSGGGMLLCDNTLLYFDLFTSLNIHDNLARHTGGGIAVDSQCIQSKPRCFFQFSNVSAVNKTSMKTVSVNLQNNIAEYAGHNLYGGFVDYCYMLAHPDETYPTFNNTIAYNTIFNITPLQTVTSDPLHICFCCDNCPNCSLHFEKLSVFPGEKFTLSVVVVGQKNGLLPGTVRMWAKNSWENIYDYIKPESVVQKVGNYCTGLDYTLYSNMSKVTVKLGVENGGFVSGYERIPNFLRRNVVVKLKKCPPVFELELLHHNTSGKYTCNCTFVNKRLPGFTCDIASKTVTKSYGSGWIGYEGSTDIVAFSKVCPYGYCKSNRALVINVLSDSQNVQCIKGRSGLLCGDCMKNFSALFGSAECKKCSNSGLFLLLVFALAGLLLVFFLTVLNLTIAEGTLSGLIFYANIVKSISAFVFPQKDSFPTSFLKVFIAWVNLDLGIPTCFYDGMDTYAKAWLRFAFPLYIWFLAILIIYLSRRFHTMVRIAGRNAVKVLATLVLLSYTNFVHTAIDAFSYVTIHHYNTSAGILQEGRTMQWLADANIAYFEPKHALLFVTSMVFGLLCLPFTLLLLFIRPLMMVSHKRPFSVIHRLKPFLDAYTGPYTDAGRFWPGMLLVARIGLSVAGGVNILDSYKTSLTTTLVILLFLLGVMGLVHPRLYRAKVLQTLECFFFWNLGLLVIGTGYFRSSQNYHMICFDLLVGAVYIAFVVIVLCHIWIKIRQWDFVSARVRILKSIIDIQKIRSKLPDFANNDLKFYPPSPSDLEREPLLAD